MKNIVVDSGPLIALFDASDRYHAHAMEFVKNLKKPPVTNLPVITEVVYVLDFSVKAQREFLYWAGHALCIDQDTVTDMPRIISLMEKYNDLPADFADASLVALCERLKTTRVASVDKDFTIYRNQARQSFENIFFGNPP